MCLCVCDERGCVHVCVRREVVVCVCVWDERECEREDPSELALKDKVKA